MRLDEYLGVEQPVMRPQLESLQQIPWKDLRRSIDVDGFQARPESPDETIVSDRHKFSLQSVETKPPPDLADHPAIGASCCFEQTNDVFRVHLPVCWDDPDPRRSAEWDPVQDTVSIAPIHFYPSRLNRLELLTEALEL